MSWKVSENFAKKNYGLDPAHYFTTPGLAWDAMLKITEVKLELLDDEARNLIQRKSFHEMLH